MPSAFEFPTPSPLGYFAALVADDEGLPLLEAATAIAQDEYPEMDVQEVLGDVDQLLARVRRRCDDATDPLQRLRALNQFFFRDMGFGGNVNNYYDPDNSYLNAVLRTRRGIPISPVRCIGRKVTCMPMNISQNTHLPTRSLSGRLLLIGSQ